MINSNFATMKDIGKQFALTSHWVGRFLKDCGLRTKEGRPSSEAFQAGWIAKKHDPLSGGYLWAWDVERVTMLLEKAGLKRVEDSVAAEKAKSEID